MSGDLPGTRLSDDCGRFADGEVQIIVHDEMIIRSALPGKSDLAFGLVVPPLDRLCIIAAAILKPPMEFLIARWKDKDHQRSGHVSSDLNTTLHIDVKQHDAAGSKSGFHWLLWRAVPVSSEYLGVLQKLAGLQHVLELIDGDEVVVHPFLFAVASWTGRRRNAEYGVNCIPDAMDNRRLSNAGGPGNDHQQTAFL